MRAAWELVVGGCLLVAAGVLVCHRGRVEARPVDPAAVWTARPQGELAVSNDDLPAPVASYALHARLDPEAHTIASQGTITFRNASNAPLGELWIHLYLNAFEHERTVFGRADASGFRGNGPGARGSIEVSRFFVREHGVDVWDPNATSPGEPDDRTDVRVTLARPVAPGETIHVDVAFVSRLPEIQLRTGYAGSYHFAGQWFPKIAKLRKDGTFAHFVFSRFSEFHADFGDYDVSVEAPSRFVVAGVGGQAERSDAGANTVHRFVQRGVHDFAFAAWDDFQRRSRTTTSGIDIAAYFPPGREAAVDLEMDAVEAGLDLYSRWYGPYPYRALTIVHPPPEATESGGMEYPTLITTGNAGPAPIAERATQLLALHELAHQWFYGIVATDENAMPFLDEGLASYATGEASKALYGPTLSVGGLAVSVDAFERARGAVAVGRAPVGASAPEFVSGDDYGRLVYARGATILRTFDRVYDGLAARAVGAYAREHRFAHPGLEQLVDAFRASGGADAAALVDAAIRGAGEVDLRAERFVDPSGALVRRMGLAFPVDVDLVALDGSVVRVAFPEGTSTAVLRRPDGAPLARAVVDPESRVLLDASLLDNTIDVRPPYPWAILGQTAIGAHLATWALRP